MEFIFARLQARFYLPLVPSKEVFSFTQQLAVEPHFGQRVQAVADQKHLLLGQQTGVNREGFAVCPILLGYPHHLLFVVAHKGIGDLCQRQQVGVNAAGSLPREPLLGVRLFELPEAA